MEVITPVVRFAPSPNGYLHLGHAYSALLNYRYAQSHKGRFLLRIEDIDTGRSRREFEEAIYEDLDWLGIAWEQPVRRQSEHFDDYRDAANTLNDLGLLYPCTASRKEILSYIAGLPNAKTYPRDPEGGMIYPGIYRDCSPNKQRMKDVGYALRLNMARAIEKLADRHQLPLTESVFVDCCEDGKKAGIKQAIARPELWGDLVLVRKDTPTSYHLSVVVDDALQGITHVIRGKDLQAATMVQRLLQAILGLNAPVYRHHDLVKSGEGRKLSKSAGDTSLRFLRSQGWSADDVKRHLFGAKL